MSTWRAAWRLIRSHPVGYALALLMWGTFQASPLALSLALKAVFDRLGEGARSDNGALGVVAVLVAVEASRWLLLWVAAFQWDGVYVSLASMVRANMLGSLLHDPAPTGDRLPGSPGEAVSHFRDDTHDLIDFVDTWLDVAGAAVCAVLTLAVLGAVDPVVTLVVAIPLAVVLAIAAALGEHLRRWRVAFRVATARVTGIVGDLTSSVLAIKTAGAEQPALARLHERNEARSRAAVRDQLGRDSLDTIANATSELSIGLVLLLVAPAMRRGDFTLGDLALFTSATVQLSSLPRWGARLVVRTKQAGVALDRMSTVLPDRGRRGVVAARSVSLRRPLPVPIAMRPAIAPLETVEVRGLTALHDTGQGIADIDLTLRAGSLTVVTGPVGAGKSTLLRAVLGLIDAEGELRLNGEVVERATALVPPRCAYLPQVPRLFSEPLAETILLGADAVHLPEAIHTACLDDDIDDMADGLVTVVGPRGVRLSGGQIQRAGAARAFVRRPQMLVVDDLSSALDVETEARVWDRLFATLDATCLVVSHRPRLLERADQVIVLDRGRVAEVRS